MTSGSKDQPKPATGAAKAEDKHAESKPKTEKCAFCGADKPVPATPGQETAEELCPNCGRGALPAEVVA